MSAAAVPPRARCCGHWNRCHGLPADLELLHFFTVKAFDHDLPKARAPTRFKHRTFFVSSDMRAAVKQGMVEYVPMSIARVPDMILLGRIPVDVALIQVSLPDEFGYVSLGVSVDIIPSALARARLVIAEVNPAMPRTMGDSTLHISRIHHLVPVVNADHRTGSACLTQEHDVQRIARYIAGIIDDGSTLQIGMGQLAHEALQYLTDRTRPRHSFRCGVRRHHSATGAWQPDRCQKNPPSLQDRRQHGSGVTPTVRLDRWQPACFLFSPSTAFATR
ncbi:MAG: hypothetical protein V9G13_07590 [Marmoricola sp.]